MRKQNQFLDIYALKQEHEKLHPGSHWFDPDTLHFFGESLGNMRVLKRTALVTDALGKVHECIVVSKYSRTKPTRPRTNYAYFDVETLEDVISF